MDISLVEWLGGGLRERVARLLPEVSCTPPAGHAGLSANAEKLSILTVFIDAAFTTLLGGVISCFCYYAT
jgi:hypothetical protein